MSNRIFYKTSKTSALLALMIPCKINKTPDLPVHRINWAHYKPAHMHDFLLSVAIALTPDNIPASGGIDNGLMLNTLPAKWRGDGPLLRQTGKCGIH